MDERLAMLFKHNFQFYGVYRLGPQEEEIAHQPQPYVLRERVRADLDPVYQHLNRDNENPIDNPDYFYVNLTYA